MRIQSTLLYLFALFSGISPACAFQVGFARGIESETVFCYSDQPGSSWKCWYCLACMQVKRQQLAHSEQQKKAAKAQIKVQGQVVGDAEGQLQRLRGSLEPLKTLWCGALFFAVIGFYFQLRETVFGKFGEVPHAANSTLSLGNIEARCLCKIV